MFTMRICYNLIVWKSNKKIRKLVEWILKQTWLLFKADQILYIMYTNAIESNDWIQILSKTALLF